MGEVYRARDTRLGREVAIKVLQSDVSSSEEGRKRFEREARAICKLSHPNVCALFDVGREGDVDYLVMELLSGETLAARLLNGPLPFEQVLRYGAQIASALAAAHAVGVAHGDLKPANAMVTATGVKLVDFGVAKALAPKAEATRLAVDSTASLALLQGSEVQGTVPYMAPEQLEGKRADATTDIFSLGAVLFEMATGLRAFSGESPSAISAAVLTTDPPPVSSTQPASSPAFDWLVRTCLAKDPEARWDSAHDVGLLLRQIAESPGAFPGDAASERRRRRWLPWAAALVAACIAAAAMLRPAPNRPPPGRPIRFSIAPPAGGSFHGSPEDPTFAVSPDGSQLVFIAVTPNAGQRLWLRRFSEAEAHPLPRTEGANSVFWS
ncbi:MAG: serine/threonine-protein kinase, partial [Myxococcaceae bacterium]